MRDNNGFEIRFRNVYAIAERMPMPMPVNILGESIDACSKIIMPTKHIIAEIMWLITMRLLVQKGSISAVIIGNVKRDARPMAIPEYSTALKYVNQ